MVGVKDTVEVTTSKGTRVAGFFVGSGIYCSVAAVVRIGSVGLLGFGNKDICSVDRRRVAVVVAATGMTAGSVVVAAASDTIFVAGGFGKGAAVV